MDKEASKLVEATGSKVISHKTKHHDAAQSAAILHARAPFRGRRFALGLVSALVVALLMMATVAQDVWAAIELAYYRAASTNNAVFLEWATVREVNINGFEILCKRVQDPETAFHPIGSRIALGSATSGATYNFDVTSGLIPGEAYCFRLREITTDNTPGEAFDLCGYGLGITPQPTTVPVSVVVGIPVTLTPTVVGVIQVPGLPAPPTLMPTADPFATATFTPIPTVDPLAVATATTDPFVTPTLSPTPTETIQSDSPLPTPNLTPTGTLTPAVSLQDGDSSAAGLEVTVLPDEEPSPTNTPEPTPTLLELPTETPTVTATLTDTIPITNPQTGELPLAVDPNAPPVIPDNGAGVVMADATPTPIYMVVTATPTPLPQVVAIPTFTPWPTAVPTETFGLANLLVPNTQNLMVGLLCLIFISASGLGALGLVTSVLYMRSQARRDRLPGPVYDRRRY